MTHQELCAELYALKPEWKTDSEYLWVEAHQEYEQDNGDPTNKAHPPIPNYTLEWCLAKLPRELKEGDDTFYRSLGVVPRSDIEVASYANGSVDRVYMRPSLICRADTPTNAALKLLIELVKAGLLKQQEEL